MDFIIVLFKNFTWESRHPAHQEQDIPRINQKKMIDHFLMIMIMSIVRVFMIMFFGVSTTT